MLVAYAHALAFGLILVVVTIHWRRIRRLEGCVRWLVRQHEAHHADIDALAESIDDVAAGGGDGEWQ